MKIGFIVALIVVLAGGAFWLMSKGSNNTATTDTTTETSTDSSIESPAADETEAEAKSVTVTFTDTGFSPADITINLGDSVVFTNKSSGSFWPASDPHPTHTVLPDFDADRAIATGQSYTYTFTRAGTWGYHDHLDASKRGSVTVK